MKNENGGHTTKENILQIVWGKDYPGDVRTSGCACTCICVEKIETNPSEPKMQLPNGVWDIIISRNRREGGKVFSMQKE